MKDSGNDHPKKKKNRSASTKHCQIALNSDPLSRPITTPLTEP